MMKLTMTIQEFAETLGLKPQTVRNRMCANPSSLPPWVAIPGSDRKVFLVSDVVAWLERHRVGVSPPV